jgi:hypothetical protein
MRCAHIFICKINHPKTRETHDFMRCKTRSHTSTALFRGGVKKGTNIYRKPSIIFIENVHACMHGFCKIFEISVFNHTTHLVGRVSIVTARALSWRHISITMGVACVPSGSPAAMRVEAVRTWAWSTSLLRTCTEMLHTCTECELKRFAHTSLLRTCT